MTSQNHIGRSDTCTQCGELADFTATGAQPCVKCSNQWNAMTSCGHAQGHSDDLCHECQDYHAEQDAQTKAALEFELATLEAAGADCNDSERSEVLGHLIDEDYWSLAEYLAWMAKEDEKKRALGWMVFGLTDDLAHWAEYGITKASELGDYLDGEHAKEVRKAAY